ncbi:hypothetical protein [Streptomyces sp. NPDC059894]|uniref:hypothetical protein n=1 Tax=unclassified Streptomyces TaxID=2593676 RepID=UPI0036563207
MPGALVDFTETGPADSLPADAARLVGRVVMEALTNIRKHAREALRHLRRPGAAPTSKVVMVTTFDDDEYVHQALHHGACGFLLEDAGLRLLAEAVRSAASGEALISPSITVRLLGARNRVETAAWAWESGLAR